MVDKKLVSWQKIEKISSPKSLCFYFLWTTQNCEYDGKHDCELGCEVEKECKLVRQVVLDTTSKGTSLYHHRNHHHHQHHHPPHLITNCGHNLQLWHLTVLHFGKLSENMKLSWSFRAAIEGKKHFFVLADVKSVPFNSGTSSAIA